MTEKQPLGHRAAAQPQQPAVVLEEEAGEPTDLGTYESLPAYPQLWEDCVRRLLYVPEEYARQLCDLFASEGVLPEDAVLDTSAGSGFPALDLVRLGYINVTCVDGSPGEVELFNQIAGQQHLALRAETLLWGDLPERFDKESFKALICKGSLWYAAGGWNKDYVPNREESLAAVRDTARIFYDLLIPGGVLYVDKFQDNEVDHKDVVGTFAVGEDMKELIFWAERDREAQIRRAKMIVKDVATGVEDGVPNVTYDLKEPELVEILESVGFNVERKHLEAEKFFAHWIARKPQS